MVYTCFVCYDDRALDVRRAPAVLEGVGASWQGVEADCDPHPDPHRCSDSVSEWGRGSEWVHFFFCNCSFVFVVPWFFSDTECTGGCGARRGAMCRPVGWAKI